MNEKLTAGVARALAAAFFRGIQREQMEHDHRGSDKDDADREADVRDYAEANWKKWLAAAKAALALSPEEPVREFPRYVKLGPTALRHLSGGVYHRDAGQWSVKAKWQDGKLVVGKEKGHLAHLSGAELLPCDDKEWSEDNKGYTTVEVDMGLWKYADEADDTTPF